METKAKCFKNAKKVLEGPQKKLFFYPPKWKLKQSALKMPKKSLKASKKKYFFFIFFIFYFFLFFPIFCIFMYVYVWKYMFLQKHIF